MIQVDNLTKYFGPVLAVDDISFQVDRGEIVGFLGPNGAGKTTTIRILTSFLPATSGIARVAGHDVMIESMDVRRHIGYLPESVPLYPEMRVEEYLLYRAKLKQVERKQTAAADRILPGSLPNSRGSPAAHRHPVQGLSPARGTGGYAGARSADPDPGRADGRARPLANSGDLGADQGAEQRAHDPPVDAYSLRSRGYLPARDHHSLGPNRPGQEAGRPGNGRRGHCDRGPRPGRASEQRA